MTCHKRIYSSQTVLSLKLFHIVDAIVDESKSSRSATSYSIITLYQAFTKGNLETEENDTLIISNIVLLGQRSLELVL